MSTYSTLQDAAQLVGGRLEEQTRGQRRLRLGEIKQLAHHLTIVENCPGAKRLAASRDGLFERLQVPAEDALIQMTLEMYVELTQRLKALDAPLGHVHVELDVCPSVPRRREDEDIPDRGAGELVASLGVHLVCSVKPTGTAKLREDGRPEGEASRRKDNDGRSADGHCALVVTVDTTVTLDETAQRPQEAGTVGRDCVFVGRTSPLLESPQVPQVCEDRVGIRTDRLGELDLPLEREHLEGREEVAIEDALDDRARDRVVLDDAAKGKRIRYGHMEARDWTHRYARGFRPPKWRTCRDMRVCSDCRRRKTASRTGTSVKSEPSRPPARRE